MRNGVVGGGSVGGSLADLLQAAGHKVAVGMPDAAERRADATCRVAPTVDAVAAAEVALPFDALASPRPRLPGALAGKIVVDVTNRVNADWSPKLVGQENSTEETVRLLPASRVVTAPDTVLADVMRPGRLVRGGGRVSVFKSSDDRAAAETVAGLARDTGFAPATVGPLRLAR